MNPREAAEEDDGKRPARDLNAGRNAGRKVEGAASAASTGGKVTGQGSGLIEQMIDSENLNLAWKKVARNKGAAGVDGLDLEVTSTRLRTNRQRIEAELLAGTYVPQPVRRVEIPKASGGTRLLGVPTVQDRWIQQAILQVIGPLFEAGFSAHSYGFRPGRSAHQAVLAAREYQLPGKQWVVDRPVNRVFLGYSFTSQPRPKIRVPEKSCTKMREKLKALFRKGRGRNLETFIQSDLNPVLRGWMNYFRLSETKSFAEALDSWVRRRLRGILWRQWKRAATRYRRLIERGLTQATARLSAGNGRGPWYNSAAAHLHAALPSKAFTTLGLISLQVRPS